MTQETKTKKFHRYIAQWFDTDNGIFPISAGFYLPEGEDPRTGPMWEFVNLTEMMALDYEVIITDITDKPHLDIALDYVHTFRAFLKSNGGLVKIREGDGTSYYEDAIQWINEIALSFDPDETYAADVLLLGCGGPTTFFRFFKHHKIVQYVYHWAGEEYTYELSGNNLDAAYEFYEAFLKREPL